MFCEVIVEKTSRNIDKKFTYKIKASQLNKIKPGTRVEVDFNGKTTEAIVINTMNESDISGSKMKYIREVKDEYPIISKNSLKIIEWMRDYYVCRYIDALKLFYPPSNNFDIQYYFKLKDSEGNFTGNEKKIIDLLNSGDETFGSLYNKFEGFEFTKELYNLLNNGNIEGYTRELSGRKSIKKLVRLEVKKNKIEEYDLRPNAYKQADIISRFITTNKNNIELNTSSSLEENFNRFPIS